MTVVLGVPVAAPPIVGPVLFDQRWCDLAYLHWPVDPAAVAPLMPPGARPDVVDGVTYVGLIPFQMRAARLGRAVPVPYLGSFGEVNVRLYSVDDAGRHGVVFRSLDASRLAVSATARLAGVPYVWSRVTASPYPSTRRDPFPAVAAGSVRLWSVERRDGTSSRIALRVGAPTEPTPLETFLSARWGMHSALRDRPVWVPNNHEAWPLYEADLVDLEDDLVAAAGIEPIGPMLRPLWSPGVRSRFGLPQIG